MIISNTIQLFVIYKLHITHIQNFVFHLCDFKTCDFITCPVATPIFHDLSIMFIYMCICVACQESISGTVQMQLFKNKHFGSILLLACNQIQIKQYLQFKDLNIYKSMESSKENGLNCFISEFFIFILFIMIPSRFIITHKTRQIKIC